MWSKRIDKSEIHPGLVRVIERTLDTLKREVQPFMVYSGLRTFDEQNKLYAIGRTKPGSIVTKARGGQSMHNYGLAVDLAPFNLLTKDPDDIWWPSPEERAGSVWQSLGEILEVSARQIGEEDPNDIDVEYEWGGRWKFLDVPHCQVRTTRKELWAGHYPWCDDVDWLVKAHTTFLFGRDWMTRRVQRLLSSQGYSIGSIDGVVGARTMSAVMQFRIDNKLSKESSALGKGFVEALVRSDHERQKPKRE
jgi:peptidoglycan LD-endopeptidase CwlK